MPQVTVPNYNPPLEGARSKLVYEDAETEAASTEVKVVIGLGVPLRRQTEIMAAIDFLLNGIRDRNLLESQFKGSPLATAVNIDRITTADRRTASDLSLVNFAPTDIGIAMGDVATNQQHVVMLDTAIEMCKNVLLENFKNQAA